MQELSKPRHCGCNFTVIAVPCRLPYRCRGGGGGLDKHYKEGWCNGWLRVLNTGILAASVFPDRVVPSCYAPCPPTVPFAVCDFAVAERWPPWGNP